MSFKYVEATALNYESIGNHQEKIKRMEIFIDQYKWK